MTSSDEPTVESLRLIAANSGLPLTEAEAAELLNGVKRNQEMAQALRDLLSPEVEPSPIFSAPRLSGMKE